MRRAIRNFFRGMISLSVFQDPTPQSNGNKAGRDIAEYFNAVGRYLDQGAKRYYEEMSDDDKKRLERHVSDSVF